MIMHEYPEIKLIKIWNAKNSYLWKFGDGPYMIIHEYLGTKLIKIWNTKNKNS